MIERVLVIGAGGFIGQALCRALISQGTRVRAVSRSGHYPNPAAEEHIASDCHDPSELTTLLDGVGAVVYLAAASTPGSTAGKPSAELGGNLAPLVATLEALQTQPSIPLVYFSSAGALYDERSAVASRETDLPRRLGPTVRRQRHDHQAVKRLRPGAGGESGLWHCTQRPGLHQAGRNPDRMGRRLRCARLPVY